MSPLVLLALLWSVPASLLVMLYAAYRQPWLELLGPGRPEDRPRVARLYVRWFPLVNGVGVGAVTLGLPGWRGWPAVLALATYCTGRGGGELGLWLRERRAAR